MVTTENFLDQCKIVGFKVINLYKKVYAKKMAAKFDNICISYRKIPRWIKCNNPFFQRKIK